MTRSTGPGRQSGASGAAARSSARSAAGPAVAPFVEAIGPAGDALEREADRIADVVARGGLGEGPIARWSAANVGDGSGLRSGEREAPETIRRAPRDSGDAASQPPTREVDSGPNLLVDDDSEVTRGQMREVGVHGTAPAAKSAQPWTLPLRALDATPSAVRGWSTGLGTDETRSASQIERTIRRYAPGDPRLEAQHRATSAQSVGECSAAQKSGQRLVKSRVFPMAFPRRRWQVASLPSASAGCSSRHSPAGHERQTRSRVQTALGTGEALPGPVRGRMESAFGANFSGVRLHTDSRGAELCAATQREGPSL